MASKKKTKTEGKVKGRYWSERRGEVGTLAKEKGKRRIAGRQGGFKER